MKPFMFLIKGVPLPTNQNYEIVSSAHVQIWIMDNKVQSAQSRAFEYLKSHLWEPTKIEYAFVISPEHLAYLHKSEVLLYQKALQNQIAAEFVTYPKNENQSVDPVTFERQ